MPVRSPAKGGKGLRVNFQSLKMGRTIACESLLECYFCFYLEFLDDVVFFEEQPVNIPYIYKDKNKNYFPDFKIIVSSGECFIVECKPISDISLEKNQIKFFIGEEWCNLNNKTFLIVTDKKIMKQPLLSNLQAIYDKQDFPIPDKYKEKIIYELYSNVEKEYTISDLSLLIDKDNKNSIKSMILRLLSDKLIRANIHLEKIDNDTRIYSINNIPRGEKYEFTSIFNR